LSDADALIVTRWARNHRCRWFGWAVCAIVALVLGGGGIFQLAETVDSGKRLGLTAVQTLSGSPLANPLDRYPLLASASGSLALLVGAGYLITLMLLVRRESRQYRVLLKLRSGEETRRCENGLIEKWARAYRHRWLRGAAFAVSALICAAGGILELAEAIALGGGAGPMLRTLFGSPPAGPPDMHRFLMMYQLTAMVSRSLLMLDAAILCTAATLWIRKQARQVRVLLRLVSAPPTSAT
jgi:hypothetical protein